MLSVEYFDQLSGAERTRQLAKILVFAVVRHFTFFNTIHGDANIRVWVLTGFKEPLKNILLHFFIFWAEKNT